MLAAGLGANSRIQRKLAGNKLPLDITLLALLTDSVNHLVWMLASNNDELPKPASIFDMLTGHKQQGAVTGFDTGEDFMKQWRR